MTTKLHKGKESCPCPSDCVRHGRCKECIAFHRERAEQTYCEYLAVKNKAPYYTVDAGAASGKQLRLLDYGPCAG